MARVRIPENEIALLLGMTIEDLQRLFGADMQRAALLVDLAVLETLHAWLSLTTVQRPPRFGPTLLYTQFGRARLHRPRKLRLYRHRGRPQFILIRANPC